MIISTFLIYWVLEYYIIFSLPLSVFWYILFGGGGGGERGCSLCYVFPAGCFHCVPCILCILHKTEFHMWPRAFLVFSEIKSFILWLTIRMLSLRASQTTAYCAHFLCSITATYHTALQLNIASLLPVSLHYFITNTCKDYLSENKNPLFLSVLE